MEESNGSTQGNAKRVKFDMEMESVTCTNASEGFVFSFTLPSANIFANKTIFFISQFRIFKGLLRYFQFKKNSPQ